MNDSAFTAAEADAYLMAHPIVQDYCDRAAVASKLRPRHEERALRCGSYLFAANFLQQLQPGLCGYQSEDDIVRTTVRAAAKELAAVGLLPGGIIGWLFAYVFFPYLGAFIRDYLFGD